MKEPPGVAVCGDAAGDAAAVRQAMWQVMRLQCVLSGVGRSKSGGSTVQGIHATLS